MGADFLTSHSINVVFHRKKGHVTKKKGSQRTLYTLQANTQGKDLQRVKFCPTHSTD